MGKLTKISTTVVSHAGMESSENTNNFYVDGRYMYEHETDNVQVTLEKSGEEFIFAVSDGMDRTSPGKNTHVSMAVELKRLDRQLKGTGGDIESKLVQIKEKFDEIDNLIYSMDIGSNTGKQREMSGAAVFISEGRIASLSRGRTRIFSLRNGSLKSVSGEENKAEKLLKMGILTNEQLKELSSNISSHAGDRRKGAGKAKIEDIEEGDLYLICTRSVYDAVDDEKLHEILSLRRDTGYIANMLLKEAIKHDASSSMTVMIIRLEEPEGFSRESFVPAAGQAKKGFEHKAAKKRENVLTYIASGLVCIIIIGVLVWLFYGQLFGGGEDRTADNMNSSSSSVSTADLPDGDLPDDGEKMPPEDGGDDPQGSLPTGGGDDAVPEDIQHVVVSGDTLQGISQKYYKDTQKYTIIMEANGIKDPNQLHIGDVLIIPQQ
ncbi:serine/threonine protein phosphatase PrpC [Anaerobacterium chartisolvens]|uniref:Serine/threonine protein phosphatase PrpC n=1 Tax=Anaerobacterium chartisolvens TaxID=1297424 RepID=A0A369AT40_9FIRM|nr:LysM peptidoglycan-binding domain-containing protein [Anaerobacterium chartisolvens]RCX12530.1 serine/threonine protein phosphatase PrpC [Anaerobacterium chartisolvens]